MKRDAPDNGGEALLVLPDARLDGLEQIAGQAVDAHEWLEKDGGGVGSLGVNRPDLYSAYVAWDDASPRRHADTVLELIAAMRRANDLADERERDLRRTISRLGDELVDARQARDAALALMNTHRCGEQAESAYGRVLALRAECDGLKSQLGQAETVLEELSECRHNFISYTDSVTEVRGEFCTLCGLRPAPAAVAAVQKIQDEFERRVRTASVLAKGGRSIDGEVQEGWARIGDLILGLLIEVRVGGGHADRDQ